MTIDEAIKRMQARVEGEFFDGDPEDLDDMKLGIEALKRIKKQRIFGLLGTWTELPGETKE